MLKLTYVIADDTENAMYPSPIITHHNHLIYTATDEIIQVADWNEIGQHIHILLRHTSQQMHVVYNMLNTRIFPYNIRAFRRANLWTSYPNLGWVVFLSQEPVITSLGRVTLQPSVRHYRHFHSIAEARRFLHRADPQLPAETLTMLDTGSSKSYH